MRYGITHEGTGFTHAGMNDWRARVFKAIFFFIPRANPDHETLYPNVKAWALEVSDDGLPQREVGLDEAGVALFRAPDARNTGFWTDMASKPFAPTDLSPLSPEQFNDLWQSLSIRAAAE